MNPARRATILSLLASAALLPPLAQAQPTRPEMGNATPAAQTYSNPDHHLTYTYPATMTPLDPASTTAIARRMIFGEEAGSNVAQAADCSRVLLSVGVGTEGASTPWARVGVVELGPPCTPAILQRNKKSTQNLLGSLVQEGTTAMGMMPVERPTLYQFQGRWAGFSAAQGQPVIAGADLQTGTPQIIGVVAIAVDGKVLAWIIQTNDAATCNQLLANTVDFGVGKPERLFSGALQNAQP